MAALAEVLAYIDELFAACEHEDYCPNGLQVAGRSEVNHILCGVTASEDLIRTALSKQADTLLVHHGYFWRGEDMRIMGMKKKRLELLIRNDINLLAYHLPLDLHPTLGNNAQLGKMLDMEVEGVLPAPAIGNYGSLVQAVSPADFSRRIEAAFARLPLHLSGGKRSIKRVAWCSGAGQKFIEEAKSLGMDAYLSGEVSEWTYHFALENHIDYYAIGHHASERYGVQRLGEAVAARFGVQYEYADLPNPV